MLCLHHLEFTNPKKEITHHCVRAIFVKYIREKKINELIINYLLNRLLTLYKLDILNKLIFNNLKPESFEKFKIQAGQVIINWYNTLYWSF